MNNRAVGGMPLQTALHDVVVVVGGGDAGAVAHHDSTFVPLVIHLLSPDLSDSDLAALRLANHATCDAVGQLVSTVRCTATTPLQHFRRRAARAFPLADTLVLELPALDQARLASQQPAKHGPVRKRLRQLCHYLYLMVYSLSSGILLFVELLFQRCLHACCSCLAVRPVHVYTEPGAIYCAAFDAVWHSALLTALRKPFHYAGRLWDRWHWQQRQLLPSLDPILQSIQHISVVHTPEAAGDVSPALLALVLDRCASLETFTCHRQCGDVLTFQGAGATAAARHASLLPQLAAMHPTAPLLHPASWPTHTCLVSATCQHPAPKPSPSALPAALATTSLRHLTVRLAEGHLWCDAAFLRHLAALPPSVTHLSLACKFTSDSHLQPPHAPPPRLPNLRHLELAAEGAAEDPYATLWHLASAWAHLTHLTRLSTRGLPWGPFRRLRNVCHLEALDTRGCSAHHLHLVPPEAAGRLPDLLHLAGHLRHLTLGADGFAVDAAALRQLSALTHLDLRAVVLTPDLCRAFTHLPKLSTLCLDPASCPTTPPAATPLPLPHRPTLPPTLSTIQLAAASTSPALAASALNTCALSTRLPPGGAVRILLTSTASVTLSSLGPMQQWCSGWRGSVLPPGWTHAANLDSCLAVVAAGQAPAEAHVLDRASAGSGNRSSVGSIGGSSSNSSWTAGIRSSSSRAFTRSSSSSSTAHRATGGRVAYARSGSTITITTGGSGIFARSGSDSSSRHATSGINNAVGRSNSSSTTTTTITTTTVTTAATGGHGDRCYEDVYVDGHVPPGRGPLQDRLVVAHAHARLVPTPRAFQQALLLVARHEAQEAALADTSSLILQNRSGQAPQAPAHGKGSPQQPARRAPASQFTVTLPGDEPLVLTPVHLLGLPPGGLPGLVTVILHNCSLLAASGGKDPAAPLCTLAAAAPNLRHADLRQLACDSGTVLQALARHCRGLEEVSLGLASGGLPCILQAVGQAMAAMWPPGSEPARGRRAGGRARRLWVPTWWGAPVDGAERARWWQQQKAALGCDVGWEYEEVGVGDGEVVQHPGMPQHWFVLRK